MKPRKDGIFMGELLVSGRVLLQSLYNCMGSISFPQKTQPTRVKWSLLKWCGCNWKQQPTNNNRRRQRPTTNNLRGHSNVTNLNSGRPWVTMDWCSKWSIESLLAQEVLFMVQKIGEPPLDVPNIRHESWDIHYQPEKTCVYRISEPSTVSLRYHDLSVMIWARV